MNLVGTVEKQLNELNKDLQERFPGTSISWKEDWPTRCFSLVDGNFKRLPRVPNLISDRKESSLNSYYMDNEGTRATEVLDALDAWIKETPIEDMPKHLGTNLEPYAKLALEVETCPC